MSDWEARMSRQAKARRPRGPRRTTTGALAADPADYGPFGQWVEPGDPEGILLEIIAARCLGITYGDPGPRLEPDLCRPCYGDRHVWLGNCWGLRHAGFLGSLDCPHSCHEGEVWLASSAAAS